MDIAPIYNGGPGGKLIPAQCPICHKGNWAKGPELLWNASDDSGRAITLQPFICEYCGFIASMLAKSQPRTKTH